MADCKCGAPVTFVKVDEQLVPLEQNETSAGKRYVITDFESKPWVAEEADPTSGRVGHADHRETCPFPR